jgi:hypothetical protein
MHHHSFASDESFSMNKLPLTLLIASMSGLTSLLRWMNCVASSTPDDFRSHPLTSRSFVSLRAYRHVHIFYLRWLVRHHEGVDQAGETLMRGKSQCQRSRGRGCYKVTVAPMATFGMTRPHAMGCCPPTTTRTRLSCTLTPHTPS